MDDLFSYYLGCDQSKSGRNHISFSGCNRRHSQWATPTSAYMENMARLFTTHQACYLDVRDDFNDSPLLY